MRARCVAVLVAIALSPAILDVAPALGASELVSLEALSDVPAPANQILERGGAVQRGDDVYNLLVATLQESLGGSADEADIVLRGAYLRRFSSADRESTAVALAIDLSAPSRARAFVDAITASSPVMARLTLTKVPAARGVQTVPVPETIIVAIPAGARVLLLLGHNAQPLTMSEWASAAWSHAEQLGATAGNSASDTNVVAAIAVAVAVILVPILAVIKVWRGRRKRPRALVQ